MTVLQVRHAAADDLPALARIFRAASLSNAGDRDALLAHPEALILSAELLAGGRTRVATDADGTVVGFAGTRPTGPGVLELDDLFVDPDADAHGGGAPADRPHRRGGRARGRRPHRGHGEPARPRLLRRGRLRGRCAGGHRLARASRVDADSGRQTPIGCQTVFVSRNGVIRASPGSAVQSGSVGRRADDALDRAGRRPLELHRRGPAARR